MCQVFLVTTVDCWGKCTTEVSGDHQLQQQHFINILDFKMYLQSRRHHSLLGMLSCEKLRLLVR